VHAGGVGSAARREHVPERREPGSHLVFRGQLAQAHLQVDDGLRRETRHRRRADVVEVRSVTERDRQSPQAPRSDDRPLRLVVVQARRPGVGALPAHDGGPGPEASVPELQGGGRRVGAGGDDLVGV